MQKTVITKLLSLLLTLVLIAAMALLVTGCDNKNQDGSDSSEKTSSAITSSNIDETEVSFTFEVVDANGEKTSREITTTKTTVGDALLELNLIEGEKGAYGLYVKTVNGVTVEYEKDGKYWAFYVNGAYATSGVDTTDIVDGATYTFKVE